MQGFPTRRDGVGRLRSVNGAATMPAFDDRSRNMPRRIAGFTLLEALAAMAVATVLAAVAIPAWSHARAAANSGSVRAELAASLLDAVNHSAIAGSEVVVCPRSNSEQCTGGIVWDNGWLVFADINGDRVRDANETLLVQTGPIDESVRLRSTPGRTRLVFQPNGSNAGSNVTFTLCDSRGVDYAITLVLSNAGQLRTGNPTREAAWNCVYGA
jgi:type IV fimbrial biogenesis protein FimT